MIFILQLFFVVDEIDSFENNRYSPVKDSLVKTPRRLISLEIHQVLPMTKNGNQILRHLLYFLLGTCLLTGGCGKSTGKNVQKSEPGKRLTAGKTSTKKKFDLKKITANKGGSQSGSEKDPDFSFVWHRDNGIDFVHYSGFDAQRAFPAANGSGIGIVDFDRDGLEDLYFGSGKSFPLEVNDAFHANQLYRNLGNWQFRKATPESNLGHAGYTSGIAIGDFDNDGFSDVYVGCYGENVLFHNQGDGSFEKVVGESIPHGRPERATGLPAEVPETPGWATSCVFLDYNHDGALDIYVCNYGIWNLEIKNNCGDREQNEPRFCSPTSVRPQPDILYENNGDGSFSDVSRKSGIYTFVTGKNGQRKQEDYRTQGVIATDFNNDGLIDLYCGNDMHPNLLLINSKGHVFQNKTELSSTGYGPNGGSKASMGVAAGDINQDGHIDLFCTNFSEEYNSFYKGLGNLQFAEVARANRLGEGARPWVGWGTEFVDIDFDGWKDVIVTNGHVDPNIKAFEKGQQHLQPCLIWKNQKGRFVLAKVAGDYFEAVHSGRALAVADLDNDGDTDFVIGHQNQRPALLENVTPQIKGQPIGLQVVGTLSNRDGIGVRLSSGGANAKGRMFHQGGGSYLSTHTGKILVNPENHEGWGVNWPSGQTGINGSIIPLKLSKVVVEPMLSKAGRKK
ncbi:VCBS repeat-containing protein [Pirellulaceae bacterium]|nr:VCBS repeat-containing protein [Pirellulaceae bacterium]